MSTVRLHRHNGTIVDIEVPIFEICKVASAMYTRMRIHKADIHYPTVLKILLTNFYAREAGSTYRLSMAPFTEAVVPPVPSTVDSELQTLVQELPEEIKYEIMSRMDGASVPALRTTSTTMVKMLPPELQYAHLIPWSCLHWVLHHPSTHRQAVIDVTLPLIGDELHYIDPVHCSTEQLHQIAVELQFRNNFMGHQGNFAVHGFDIILDHFTKKNIGGMGLHLLFIKDPQLNKRPLQQFINEAPQAMHLITDHQDDTIPIPDTDTLLYLPFRTHTSAFVKRGQEIKVINDPVFRYRLALAMPQHRDRILYWTKPSDKQKFIRNVSSMTLIHDTIQDLVTHGEFVRELLK